MTSFLIWISVLSVFTVKIVHSNPKVDVAFTIGSVTDTTALLTWNASASDFTGITYTLSIEPSGPVLTNVSGGGPVFSIAGSINITGLRPGAEYNITGIFRDGVGTRNIKIDPFNAVPLNARFIRMYNNDSTVTMKWKPHPDSIQTSIQFYYHLRGEPTPLATTLKFPYTEYTTVSLYPGALYLYYWRTVSGTAETRWRETFLLIAPLAPKSLAITTNITSMTVQWMSPESVIYLYKLEYTMAGFTNWTTMSVLGTYTSFVINDLVPGEHYTVRMFGLSTYGTKPSRDSISENATMVPVITTNLTEDVDGTSTDKVVITYTEETGHGVFDEYIFSINTESEPVKKINNDTDRVVLFSGLIPGSLYTITARTRSGDRLSSPKSLQVLTVPGTPTVTCYETQLRDITIAIERHIGGITYYIIGCSGQTCKSQRTILPSDGSITRLTYQYLTPFNFYTFNVSVFQTLESQDKRSATVMLNCSTFETAPNAVGSLYLDVDGYNVTLTWTEPIVTNGRIRHYTLSYIGIKENAPLKEENTTFDAEQLSHTFANLTAGYKYIFTIRAVTVVAGAPTEIQHYFPILAPSIAAQYVDNPEDMKPVVNADPVATEVSVSMVNPFTEKNGDILGYSVIIATSTTKLGDDSTLMNWSEARKVSFKRAYIAIYKCIDLFDINSDCGYKTTQARRRRDTRDEVTVEIGVYTECAAESTEYCNGQLQGDTPYYVLIRAYTETGLYTDTPFSDAITTAKPLDTSSITITTVASVVSFVVGCALVGVIVCCVFRSRRRAAKQEDSDDTTAKSSHNPVDYEIVHDNTTGKDSVSQQATENTPYEEISIKPIKDEKSQYMVLDKPVYYENMVDESSEYYNNPNQSTKEPSQYQQLQYKN